MKFCTCNGKQKHFSIILSLGILCTIVTLQLYYSYPSPPLQVSPVPQNTKFPQFPSLYMMLSSMGFKCKRIGLQVSSNVIDTQGCEKYTFKKLIQIVKKIYPSMSFFREREIKEWTQVQNAYTNTITRRIEVWCQRWYQQALSN